jgi:hypothetical protein
MPVFVRKCVGFFQNKGEMMSGPEGGMVVFALQAFRDNACMLCHFAMCPTSQKHFSQKRWGSAVKACILWDLWAWRVFSCVNEILIFLCYPNRPQPPPTPRGSLWHYFDLKSVNSRTNSLKFFGACNLFATKIVGDMQYMGCQ